MQNMLLHQIAAREHRRRVFFTGSTDVRAGEGCCYVANYGTATDANGERDKRVAMPDNTNNMNFAGVFAESKPGLSGGQYVDIFEPGSVCMIAVGANCTINSTRLTCSAGSGAAGTGDAGIFSLDGFRGRGSATILQTKTAVLVKELDGATPYTWTAATKTLTDGLSGGSFANVAAGDIVYVLGGANDTTGRATPGRYTVASKTSSNAIVLSSSISSANLDPVAFYIVAAARPMVLARLDDGDESGLIEFVTPANNGAVTVMAGGWTYFLGGFTAPDGDSTSALVPGNSRVHRKGYKLFGAVGTNDQMVTPSSSTAQRLDGSTTLAGLEFDGDLDTAVLHWHNKLWRNVFNSGPTES